MGKSPKLPETGEKAILSCRSRGELGAEIPANGYFHDFLAKATP